MLNVSRPMRRVAHRLRERPRHGELSRQTLVLVAFGTLLALGLLASAGYFISKQRPAPVLAAANDDEIYTGSILYMPDEGKFCRQILFDNLTGLLSDNGKVDCDRAAYRGTDGTPKRWSSARVQVISSGFRDR
jgi:hypothetical protein